MVRRRGRGLPWRCRASHGGIMRHVLHRPENRERLAPSVSVPPGPVYVREPAFQAFSILRVGFAALPILAGADKFFHLLVDWNQYLAPVVMRVIGGHLDEADQVHEAAD